MVLDQVSTTLFHTRPLFPGPEHREDLIHTDSSNERGAPIELFSEVNRVKLEQFYTSEPRTGAKLRARGWTPENIAFQLDEIIEPDVFNRITEALRLFAWNNVEANNLFNHTISMIWTWAEDSPEHVIRAVVAHIESYYFQSLAGDKAAEKRIQLGAAYILACGQKPYSMMPIADEYENMKELNWGSGEFAFFQNLIGQVRQRGHAVHRIEVDALMKFALRKGIDADVIQRLSEVHRRDGIVENVFHFFDIARIKKDFSSEALLVELAY